MEDVQCRIKCLLSEDILLERIKGTTYKLSYDNQACRETCLSLMENGWIYLGWSGISRGGGTERLKLSITEKANEYTVMEGKFEVLPYLRNTARLMIFCTVAAMSYFLIQGMMTGIAGFLFFLTPEIYLYKKLPRLYARRYGRQKLYEYIGNTLQGEIEFVYKIKGKEDIHNLYDDNCQNLGEVKKVEFNEGNGQYQVCLVGEKNTIVFISAQKIEVDLEMFLNRR